MDFAALPSLVLSAVLAKLDDDVQAACALVCRNWLQVFRSGRQSLRVVIRRPRDDSPQGTIGGDELRVLLRQFTNITTLRIAAEETIPALPALPQLRALDLESCGLSSQPQSSWQLLKNLTSLSFMEFDCSRFKGEEVLLGLPLLQEICVTVSCGEINNFLSRIPELPGLKSFSLATYTDDVERDAAATFPWMQNLERLQLRLVTTSKRTAIDQLPEIILGSCGRLQHLSLSMAVCNNSIITKAAGLKHLRSFQVHAVEFERHITGEAIAAWLKLEDRLTAVCITEDCSPFIFDADWDDPSRFSRLPSGLEALSFPQLLSAEDGKVSTASLTHLVGLRQLRLDIATLSPVEPLTALRGLTKLQIQFEADPFPAEQIERARVLGALPQLRELVLDLWVMKRMEPSFEAALLSGIGQSSAKTNLGVYVKQSSMSFFPTSFVAKLGERLVDLRIRCVPALLEFDMIGNQGRESPVPGAVMLPRLDRLRRLQLGFFRPADFTEWLGPLRKQGIHILPQLRFVCLVIDSLMWDMFEKQHRQLEEAVCSAFPYVVEFCIHSSMEDVPLQLCTSCMANRMDKYAWPEGSHLY